MSKFGLDYYSHEYYNDIAAVLIRVNIMLVDTFIIVLESVPVNQNERKEVLFVNQSKFSDFGLVVKTELLRRGKEQKWLEEAVSEKTGLYVDSGYMYKVLTGQRNAPKIVAAICDILSIREGAEHGTN
jgi:hypothetical protein